MKICKAIIINHKCKNSMSKMDDDKKSRILYRVPFNIESDNENENYDLAIYFDVWENGIGSDYGLLGCYMVIYRLLY